MLAFHGYIAWTLARPHIDPLYSNPQAAVGLPYTDVTFPSHNHKSKLQGWYIPADSNNTVIFSHGYGGNREEWWVPIYDLAKRLYQENYNVLMFDYGYVQPGGEHIVTGGIQESQELLGAVDFIKEKGALNVFIWGFSMGAGTALQAALRGADVSGMILDSTFLLNADTLYHNMKKYVNLPKYPSLPLVRIFFPLLNGVSLQQIPFQNVTSAKYKMPIFFIHGEQDERAPYEMIESLYAQQSNKQSRLWLLPNATHELLYRADPNAYLERTIGFLKSITIQWKSFGKSR
jgi:pimeloyl-ACP methyl ester carboxylesterase